jgi:hypothetical protein
MDAWKKPTASLAVNLIEHWRSGEFLTLLLAILARRRIAATFFVSGADAAKPENKEMLLAVVRNGHELGSRGYFDPAPAGVLANEAVIEAHVARADEAIAQAVGVRPFGFRSPSGEATPALVEALARRGYRYDASNRAAAAGAPFVWSTDDGDVVAIPRTRLPFLGTPLDAGPLGVLARRVGTPAALRYFEFALELCSLGSAQPSISLDPLDLLDPSEVPETLANHPAMRWDYADKRLFIEQILDRMQAGFAVTTIGAHAERVRTAMARRLPSLQGKAEIV